MATTALNSGDLRGQFLNLMVTQLKYQDPLEPVGQEDFIQQLAQFSTVEGIETLNANFGDLLKLQELTQGAQLVGKTAEYKSDLGTSTGVVDSARLVNGQLQLRIQGRDVPLGDITAIINAAAISN